MPEKLRGFRGVVVTRLLENALAAEKIKPGDLLIAVNSAQIGNANEFYLHLAASAAESATNIHLIREGKPLRVNLPPLPRKE
jgi:S1-C subfamily serine protease